MLSLPVPACLEGQPGLPGSFHFLGLTGNAKINLYIVLTTNNILCHYSITGLADLGANGERHAIDLPHQPR